MSSGQGVGGGRPMKYSSAKKLEAAIEDYFENVATKRVDGEVVGFMPTISGLAYHLDICTVTLRNYGKNEKFFSIIKRARQRVEQALEERLYSNQVTGSIFNLKCNFGWRDGEKEESTDMAAALLALANKLPD